MFFRLSMTLISSIVRPAATDGLFFGSPFFSTVKECPSFWTEGWAFSTDIEVDPQLGKGLDSGLDRTIVCSTVSTLTEGRSGLASFVLLFRARFGDAVVVALSFTLDFVVFCTDF